MTLSDTQEISNRINPGGDKLVRGSGTSVDTNDPVFLAHSGGVHYVSFFGVASNSLSVPDDATLDFTGDIEIVAHLYMDEWNSGSAEVCISKGSATWELRRDASGNPQLYINGAGYASTVAISTVGTDEAYLWVKATHRKSDGRIQFFYAADAASEPGSFTQLGADVTGPTAATVTNSNAVHVGQQPGTGAPMSGGVKRVIVRGAIDGADVLDIHPASDIDTSSDPDAGQTSFTATTGQTVTVNRATSGLQTAVVTRPVWILDGTDDYLQLPASDTPSFTKAAGKFTALALYRKHSATSAGTFANERVFSFESAGNDGCDILLNSSDNLVARCGDGTAVTPTIGASTASRLTVVGFVVDDGSLYGYSDDNGLTTAAALSGIATEPTHGAGRLGSRGDAVSNVYEGEIFAYLGFDGVALTEEQLDTLANQLRTGNY